MASRMRRASVRTPHPNRFLEGGYARLEPSLASSAGLRLTGLLFLRLPLREKQLDVRVFIEEGAGAAIPGVRQLSERLYDPLRISHRRLGGALRLMAERPLMDVEGLVADRAGLPEPLGVLLVRRLQGVVQGKIVTRDLSRAPTELLDDADRLDDLLELPSEGVCRIAVDRVSSQIGHGLCVGRVRFCARRFCIRCNCRRCVLGVN
jgi:hypothetical protein